MELTPVQQIMLTVLLGKEDRTAWKRLQACERTRAWAKNNPERCAENRRAWQKKNPEKVRAASLAWKKNNLDRTKATNSAWQKRNPEKVRANARAWYHRHPEEAKEKTRMWQKKNVERVRAVVRKRQKSRRDTDPAFRLLSAMRIRVSKVLKRNSKASRTLVLLGCTIPELRAHLEASFVPGMTWENYGPVWHVDHKRPCASFDFSDPAQQRECFHYTNLQPLFAEDNLLKRDAWDGV